MLHNKKQQTKKVQFTDLPNILLLRKTSCFKWNIVTTFSEHMLSRNPESRSLQGSKKNGSLLSFLIGKYEPSGPVKHWSTHHSYFGFHHPPSSDKDIINGTNLFILLFIGDEHWFNEGSSITRWFDSFFGNLSESPKDAAQFPTKKDNKTQIIRLILNL